MDELDIEKINSEIKICKLCRLSNSRTNAVPGEGKIPSDLMIIGEAPGRNEDLLGRPFVGEAGKLLDKCLKEVGIDRNNSYITNIVKCRPPNNRKPSKEEIDICTKAFLFKQIEIVDPKVILSLGVSASYGLGFKFSRIKDILGVHQMFIAGKERKVYVAFHPSFPLRFNSLIPQFINQLKEVKLLLSQF
ncbi:MAG: uracil-DNA glycosylase [Candidatus Parvarchaeota archaeon]|nr:uracil-DNA glycosylase [Candidatus Rehaiarchaeum fermentans]MCW1293382.1 uracil-DNA glycosylase [Candidatus Rehaiarchaeum fermentans]